MIWQIMNNDTNKVLILLVEDSRTDAELCLREMKKSVFADNLVWVKDGEEALNFIFCTGPFFNRSVMNVPSLILLDLRLPKVDGIEVLRRIRSDERTKSIPVVVMTSSKEDRDKAESRILGVHTYINKPVKYDEFFRTVSDLGIFWQLEKQRRHKEVDD